MEDGFAMDEERDVREAVVAGVCVVVAVGVMGGVV